MVEAADVMRIETALAEGSMSRMEMRDPAKRYHMMTVAELQSDSPEVRLEAVAGGHGLCRGEGRWT